MSLLHIGVLLPFIGASLIPIIYYYNKRIHPGYLALLFPLAALLCFLSVTPGGSIAQYEWMPHIGLNLNFKLDGLSFLFTLLITVIGTLVIYYSIHYLNRKEALGNFYCYLLLFMGAMLGVVLSDNILSLYLFWELTSISSFLLIAFWYHKEKSLEGALKSMLITVFGGLMLLGGLLSLATITHTFSITVMFQQSDELLKSSLFIPAMIFILLAAFTKSAQFPFHIWLPDAMEAPTPVSAYLHSATMVKAGIYLVARLTPLFAVSSSWIYTVSFIGALTLFWASFNAVKQQDLKGILAYSTVSQLGLMMTLLGLGGMGIYYLHEGIYYMAIAACIFHIFNHASFKGALFMVTGIIDHETGTRDLRRLSGLIQLMPLTFTIALIGALSMAGVPPFNGFLSKEMFLDSIFDAGESTLFPLPLLIIIAFLTIIGSLFTFIYSVKLLKDIFFGNEPKVEKHVHEAPIRLLAAPILLAAVVIVTGILPQLVTPLINNGTSAVLNTAAPHIHISHWHGVNLPLITTLLIFTAGLGLVFSYRYWQQIYKLQPDKWTFNSLYQLGLTQSQRLSYRVNNAVIGRGSRLHLILIFAALIVLTSIVLVAAPLTFGHWKLSPIRPFEWLLAILMLIATFMIVIARSRIFSIIMLSAIGYSVGLFFVFFNAPDLALTQLTIETISTALFLMCFYHLPKLSRHDESRPFQLTNAVIAAASGAAVTVIALIAYGHRYYSSIAEYYIKNVYEKAAGKNMVNVILVDYRGFDTLFESTVLGIAGIGIYTLIKLRMRKDDHHEETE